MKLAGFIGCLFLVAPLGLAAQNASYGVSYGLAGSQITTLIGPDGKASPTTRAFPTAEFVPGFDTGFPPLGWKCRQRPAPITLKVLDSGCISNCIARMSGRLPARSMNLRGWTAKGRKAQVGSSDDAALEARTLTVPFTFDADRMSSADIWVPGLTAVVSVELLSVKYTDGSMWTPVQGHACRVAPDHLMQITQ